jgi:hypothetical protein
MSLLYLTPFGRNSRLNPHPVHRYFRVHSLDIQYTHLRHPPIIIDHLFSRPLLLYTRNPRPFMVFRICGRERPLVLTRSPVHLPCIHRTPVHSWFFASMDGSGRLYSPVLPSICLVYTKFPSIHGFTCLWTGAAACIHLFSRPFALYTQNSRQRTLYTNLLCCLRLLPV